MRWTRPCGAHSCIRVRSVCPPNASSSKRRSPINSLKNSEERAQALPMGDPTNPATAIGPLINQRAVDLVHAHVQEAIAGGAELVCGGQYDNLIYHPTIVTDVKPNMRLFTDQTFGPVAPIIVVNDAEEALAVANNSKYGLSSGILTKDFNRALDMALRLETGMVHIGDQTVNDEPQAPIRRSQRQWLRSFWRTGCSR